MQRQILSNFGSENFSERQRHLKSDRQIGQTKIKTEILGFWFFNNNIFFSSKSWFLHGGMFAAWNEKPKKPNMSQQNVIGFPSIGHFVGDLAQKGKQK